jgi:hypothetical protein
MAERRQGGFSSGRMPVYESDSVLLITALAAPAAGVWGDIDDGRKLRPHSIGGNALDVVIVALIRLDTLIDIDVVLGSLVVPAPGTASSLIRSNSPSSSTER